MTSTNLIVSNTKTTPALAALPEGFLVTTSNKSGRRTVRPISRVEFRKAHKLTNAAAKRQYALHMRQFTVAAAADFSAQIAQGLVAKAISVSSSGVRGYSLTEGAPVAVAEPTADQAREVYAKSLGLTVAELDALVGVGKTE
jgi:hypothetical protein